MSAALHICPTSDRRLAAMLDYCRERGWRPVAVSEDITALAALVEAGIVDVVLTPVWRQDLAAAVQAVGGRLEALRRPSRPTASHDLTALVDALVATGQLTSGGAAQLLSAPGPAASAQPQPYRRPRRAA